MIKKKLSFKETEHFYIWETDNDVFLSSKNKIEDIDTLKELTGIEKFYYTDQIHSEKITIIDKDIFEYSNSDGLISFNELKYPLLIRTADCMPVFISSSKVKALLHAGRKGVELNIFNTFLDLIRNKQIKKTEIIFFFGPHICRDCYEINRETRETFPLFKKAKDYLISSGLDEKQIINSEICSLENKELFSYRRNNTKKRIYNLLIPKDLYRKYRQKNQLF